MDAIKAKQVLPFFGLNGKHWNKYRGLSTPALRASGRDDVSDDWPEAPLSWLT